MQTCPLWRGFAFLGLPDARGGLTPEVISLIPVSWKTAGDITHSSGGYISSCALAASCAMHRNKLGRARANPHWERDHHYRRRTHRGECGAVPSFALSKTRSCCGINSDPRPVFRQRRALFREPRRRVESGPGTERRITHPHSFRTRESARFRLDRKSTRLNSSHALLSRMPSSA